MWASSVSMSVEQRRTQVLERQDFPAGSVRLTKASSRFDRRRRFFAVEFLPAASRGTELEEYAWRVVTNWPVSDGPAEPWAFYRATWLTVRAM